MRRTSTRLAKSRPARARPGVPLRVLVVCSTQSGYLRDVFVGAVRYQRTNPGRVQLSLCKERFERSIAHWDGQGVIAPVTSRRMAGIIRQRKLAAVNISSRLGDIGLASVAPDDRAVGKVAVEHLFERGFRSLAYYQPLGPNRYVERAAAVRQAAEEVGLRCQTLRPPGKGRRGLQISERRQLARQLDAAPKALGVIAAHDAFAQDLYEACGVAELAIPGQVAIVGIDNDEFLCESFEPPLSSVEVQAERVGYEAAALLVKLMEGESTSPQPIRIAPMGMVVRQSSDVLAVDDPLVAHIMRHIAAHADQTLRVADLSEQVPLSRRGMERRFERVLGRSVLDEIHRVKIERIKQMLLGSTQTVEEIARACGFEYATHMSTLFRRKVGMTPKTFRVRFGSTGQC